MNQYTCNIIYSLDLDKDKYHSYIEYISKQIKSFFKFFQCKYLIGKFNLGNYFKRNSRDIPKKYQNKKIRNLN